MTDMLRGNDGERYDSGTSDAALRLDTEGHDDDAAGSKNRGPSVLIIEGAEPACRLLRFARDQIAHRCLIIYVQQRPSCVVLDLDLHGLAALDVCRRVRAQADGLEVTILMMTAQKSVRAFDAALLAGADEILLKPVSDSELLERVEHALKPNKHNGGELRRRCERLCQQRAKLAAEGVVTG